MGYTVAKIFVIAITTTTGITAKQINPWLPPSFCRNGAIPCSSNGQLLTECEVGCSPGTPCGCPASCSCHAAPTGQQRAHQQRGYCCKHHCPNGYIPYNDPLTGQPKPCNADCNFSPFCTNSCPASYTCHDWDGSGNGFCCKSVTGNCPDNHLPYIDSSSGLEKKCKVGCSPFSSCGCSNIYSCHPLTGDIGICCRPFPVCTWVPSGSYLVECNPLGHWSQCDGIYDTTCAYAQGLEKFVCCIP